MGTRISRSVLAGIKKISEAAAPREACGLLFGSEDFVTAFQAVQNVAEDPENRFEIDPAALFAALRAERAGGPKVAGYWHSHPSGDARPSATDAAMAAPDGKLWLIVTADRVALWRPAERQVFWWSSEDRARGDGRPTQMDTIIGFDRVPLSTGEVRDLLPLDKCDEALVPLLADAGYPAVAPYLDELLGWTFDPNWPIAGPMADWLATLGAPMIEPLRRVLRGDDGDGKANCLWSVARRLDPSVRAGLIDDLRALADAPSANDRAEDADSCARALLAEWGAAR